MEAYLLLAYYIRITIFNAYNIKYIIMKDIVNSPNTRSLIAKKNHNGGKLPKKVAVIYTDARREYYYTDEEFYTVDGSDEEAEAFGPYLKSLGVEVCYIKGDSDIATNLQRKSQIWQLTS